MGYYHRFADSRQGLLGKDPSSFEGDAKRILGTGPAIVVKKNCLHKLLRRK